MDIEKLRQMILDRINDNQIEEKIYAEDHNNDMRYFKRGQATEGLIILRILEKLES